MKMLVRDESRSRREEEAEEQIGLSGQALPSMNRKQLGSKRVVLVGDR